MTPHRESSSSKALVRRPRVLSPAKWLRCTPTRTSAGVFDLCFRDGDFAGSTAFGALLDLAGSAGAIGVMARAGFEIVVFAVGPALAMPGMTGIMNPCEAAGAQTVH